MVHHMQCRGIYPCTSPNATSLHWNPSNPIPGNSPVSPQMFHPTNPTNNNGPPVTVAMATVPPTAKAGQQAPALCTMVPPRTERCHRRRFPNTTSTRRVPWQNHHQGGKGQVITTAYSTKNGLNGLRWHKMGSTCRKRWNSPRSGNGLVCSHRESRSKRCAIQPDPKEGVHECRTGENKVLIAGVGPNQ